MLIILIVMCAFCLYAVVHFHTIAVISTAEQLPRVTYNRSFWLVLFVASCAAVVVATKLRGKWG